MGLFVTYITDTHQRVGYPYSSINLSGGADVRS
jgi:hypothetical protein